MISPLQVLRYCAPVAFGAVGESVVQRSGIINVGLEGLMLCSAYAATVASSSSHNPWIGLGAGVLAGLLVILIFGLLTIQFALDQIVAGTAINLLSLGLCGTLFEMQNKTGKLMNLPAIPMLIGKLDAVEVLLIISAIAIGVTLYKTNYGLKLRSVGEYPPSTEAAGFSPIKFQVQALAIGGLMGGLGGSYLALGVAQSFATEMVAGRGFIAIALVTFARWRPVGILFSALLLGIFESLQFELQMSGSQIPKSILLALPYVATLVILIFVGKGTQAPQSLGQPIKGNKR